MAVRLDIIFAKLCEELGLGLMVDEPKQVFGGLIHNMYKLKTTNNQYAVKQLNPQIMMRSCAYENYVFAEKVAQKMQKENIPALSAIEINGKCLHVFDDIYYMVFPWVDGKVINSNDVDVNICKIMGSILANMHKIDFSYMSKDIGNGPVYEKIDWKKYIVLSRQKQMIYAEMLNQYMGDLYNWDEHVIDAKNDIFIENVVSHCDLDCKNVLWDNGKPVIIDWESAGYVNPMQELLDVALAWSGYEEQKIDKNLFMAVVDSYFDIRAKLKYDWNAVLWFLCIGKLNWLEYNLKRSLKLEQANFDEQNLAVNEVHKSLICLVYYTNKIAEIKDWLA